MDVRELKAQSDIFLDKIGKDKIFELAAALSYYTALSLAPLLILLVTFVTILDASFKNSILTQIEDYVGQEGASAIKVIADGVSDLPNVQSWAGFFGILTLLFAAGAIVGQLRRSLNLIFEVHLDKPEVPKNNTITKASLRLLRQNIFNMAMVLAFIFIAIGSLLISSVVSLNFEGTQYYFDQAMSFIFSLVIFSLLFSAVYFLLPEKKIAPRTAITSGVLTASFFSIGNGLIGLYLGRSALVSSYGAVGSLIVLMIWAYYSSIIIFFSAEISHHVSKKKRHQSF